MRWRTTRKFVRGPLINAQVHRILAHPYYEGKVTFNDVLYDGGHEPLVDEIT